ncbi:MAG: asparagine synthase (glutamine-hydrolyzing), partial [Vulcanimicrobiaceae bacterium]
MIRSPHEAGGNVCGIAGIWHLDGRPLASGAIERFTRALAHRGPDGEGIELLGDDRTLGLGHRRLAIFDRSAAGRQPMRSADGRYWISFNGEIYNFVELRRELESVGYRFTSRTDTEVILAAYDRFGEDCQRRFNGMWAFAIWDVARRRLFLSRDRFGVKPLYYVVERDRFAFASELKAFLQLDEFEATEDSASLARVLADNFALEGTEDSLLQGVRRLPGGCAMTVSASGPAVRRWWNTLDHRVEVAADFGRQAAEFRELFFDACRLRVRSDVPAATCLSGGLDSSSVVGALSAVDRRDGLRANARSAPDWRATFVADFAGTPLDETAYAD